MQFYDIYIYLIEIYDLKYAIMYNNNIIFNIQLLIIIIIIISDVCIIAYIIFVNSYILNVKHVIFQTYGL